MQTFSEGGEERVMADDTKGSKSPYLLDLSPVSQRPNSRPVNEQRIPLMTDDAKGSKSYLLDLSPVLQRPNSK